MIQLPHCFSPVIRTIGDLTFSGHQFLETIRSYTVWNKVSIACKNIGSNSFNVISQIATEVLCSLIKTHIGLS